MGQLPTHPGRWWAGRKQPPEARGTRQTRVPGSQPDPGSFLPARPVPLANCRLPFPVLSAREQRKLGWSPGMARRVLKPRRSPTRPKPPLSQEERQSRILGVLSCLPWMELRLGRGAEKALDRCVLKGGTAGGERGVKTARLEVKRLGPDTVSAPHLVTLDESQNLPIHQLKLLSWNAHHSLGPFQL